MMISFSNIVNSLGFVEVSRVHTRVGMDPGYLIISLKGPGSLLFEACAESCEHKRRQNFDRLHRLLLPLLASSHQRSSQQREETLPLLLSRAPTPQGSQHDRSL